MDAKQLYTDKADTYLKFNALFRSRQALQAFFKTYDGLRPGLRVLDAGCGAGDATLALTQALRRRRLEVAEICAFDLTPAMLSRFRQALARENVQGVQLFEADVLELQRLPPEWTNFDLIVSVAMLEYVPRPALATALAALRARLAREGRLLVFITRRNWVTKPLIETLWHAHRYTRDEVRSAFESAGLGTPRFRRFPASHFWQNVWAHVPESEPATRPTRCD
ncbi:MAG TPA: class I SAM-dependent methyltransferase [Steroidobacteraceae bacterium]|jgi:ubiquinone/menaquinone biosynthesis C-methylase UbiE|nr:class I SAM-dependent methyltransferase [Steroidobacteraceae bacterium]